MAQKQTRLRALEIALSQIGVRETPADSNSGPKVREYQAATSLGGTGWPWCAAFVNWCFRQAGKALEYPTASVGELSRWAKQKGYVVSVPARGDIVCFDFDGNGVYDNHVGFVLDVDTLHGVIHTVEGNTAYGNDANGGMVMKRTRPMGRYCLYIVIPGKVTVASKAKVAVKKPVLKAKAKVAKVIDPYVLKRMFLPQLNVYSYRVEKRSAPGGQEVK